MLDLTTKNLRRTIGRLYWSLKVSQLKRKHLGKARVPYTLPCGLELSLRLDDVIAQRILLSSQYEPVESAVIYSLVNPGMTVIDIGANIGLHSLHLSKQVGSQGQVLAFEPNLTVAKELSNNIKLNGIVNTTVFELALCEQNGESLFFFPLSGSEAMGSLQNNGRFKVKTKAKVPTARLDTVLAEQHIHRVDFIKIDAEGAELAILQGAEKILSSDVKPIILYESVLSNTKAFDYTPSDLNSFISNKGYRIESIDPKSYLALPTSG